MDKVSARLASRVTQSSPAHRQQAITKNARGPAVIMGDVKIYKRAEVAERDGRGGGPLWIIYKDSVYDITKYVDEHPGGLDPIAGEAGGDASRAFEDVGHSADARAVLASHKIGEILEEEKKYDANGKKRKVVAAPESGGGRSCLSVITCGLLGS